MEEPSQWIQIFSLKFQMFSHFWSHVNYSQNYRVSEIINKLHYFAHHSIKWVALLDSLYVHNSFSKYIGSSNFVVEMLKQYKIISPKFGNCDKLEFALVETKKNHVNIDIFSKNM